MGPHATLARWERGYLTVWGKTQWVGDGTQRELTTVFGLSGDDVRVISPSSGSPPLTSSLARSSPLAATSARGRSVVGRSRRPLI